MRNMGIAGVGGRRPGSGTGLRVVLVLRGTRWGVMRRGCGIRVDVVGG